MMYFDNRALKKEIKRLDTRVEMAEDSRRDAEAKSRTLLSDREKQETEINKITKERNKFKKLVREQTGADLLVNALVELGVFPKPTKEYDAFAEQTRLQQQAQGAQQHYHGMGGLANQLGMGAVGSLIR